MPDKKARLCAEREQTLEKLQRLRSYLSTRIDQISAGGKDPVDAASDIHEREKTLALIRTMERKLAGIERASDAIEKGSYGICEICGERINPARLAAIPHATTCVSCQDKLDRRVRYQGRPP